MTQFNGRQLESCVELSSMEMEHVQGGETVDSFSINFSSIKIEYKPQKEN